MKKVIVPLLAVLLLLCNCGSGAGENPPETDGGRSSGRERRSSAEPVRETEYLRIEGLYVDNTSGDGEGRKVLYLLYTATAAGRRPLSLDSASMLVLADGERSYEAVRIPKACAWMEGVYYSGYLAEIAPGESLRVAETFRVPEEDLSPGTPLFFEKPRIPDMDRLCMNTSDIVFLDGPEAVAQAADPEGYAAALDRRTDAGDAAERVRQRINGRSWSIEVEGKWYRVDFTPPDNFVLTVSDTPTPIDIDAPPSGKYTVARGFLFCTVAATGETVEIPYTYTGEGADEVFTLDLYAAFDPNAG